MSTAAPPDILVHPKFDPLMNTPHTIADIHGGRYGMKTETVWRIAIWRAMHEPLRVLGARETLASIKDSSHKTISDIIYGHQMATSQNGPFEIQSDRIIRREGDRIVSEVFYVGVRESIRDKKSLAGIDLVVFDEAGKVSQDTLDVFLPTIIRKAGCKAWFIWNPESTADPIYKWFNAKPGPSNCIHIETSYKDNRWLSAESRQLVEDCRLSDPDKYEHIYEGKPMANVAGAIFADEMKVAKIGRVPHDPLKPVYTAWDIGMDRTCIWFVQAYDGQLWFIDYYQNFNKDLPHYLILLQDKKKYLWGRDHLPHDAVDTQLHQKGIIKYSQDKSATVQTIMRDAGRDAHVGPKLGKRDRISFARTKFPICHFDAEKCVDGLDALRNYQWDRDLDDDGQRKPLHNWASHPADAFMEAAVSVKERAKRVLPVAHTGMAVAEI